MIALSRWADVAAALRDPRLVPPGGAPPVAHPPLAGERVLAFHGEGERAAEALLAPLAADAPVDLVPAFAVPWGLALAAHATGISRDAAHALAPHARAVFTHAAQATGPEIADEARDATLMLARALPDGAGPLGVQAFVALAHTVPALVLDAWRVLAEHPAEQQRLRADAAQLPGAVEELLRLAGPSQVVFREAAGERLALRLGDANRDAARFPDPDRFDPARGAGHLALGRGAHSCYGAPFVRAALAAATSVLLRTTTGATLAGDPAWEGGATIRALASLPVVLHRGPGDVAPAAT